MVCKKSDVIPPNAREGQRREGLTLRVVRGARGWQTSQYMEVNRASIKAVRKTVRHEHKATDLKMSRHLDGEPSSSFPNPASSSS